MQIETKLLSHSYLPEGVAFVAKRNKNDKFFVASKVNSFGGWNVEAVLIDSGCNSILLPILDGQLDQLLVVFPLETHTWSASISNGVNGSGITLKVEHFARQFQTTLCKDIQDPDKATKFEHLMLRFHLCLADAKALVHEPHPLFASLIEKEKAYIRLFVEEHSNRLSQRRTHALVGQSLLSNNLIVTIQLRGITAAFASNLFPTIDLLELKKLNSFIVSTPDNFEDLEDYGRLGDEPVTLYRDEDRDLSIG